MIAPLRLRDGSTLGAHGRLLFALYEKKGGRYPDEFTDDQWLAMGRLLGRLHQVGARRQPHDRPRLHPQASTRAHLDFLRASGLLPADLAPAYEQVSAAIVDEITPLFARTESIRIHGDCHRGNIIDRPGESLHLIDFDDMAVGAPVQDFWMLLPGTLADAAVEADLLIEGYETFRPFDRTSLRLIEPLRAMRYVHYSAWCARQVVEDGHSPVIPDFGSRTYWQTETRELADQLERIREGAQPFGNLLF